MGLRARTLLLRVLFEALRKIQKVLKHSHYPDFFVSGRSTGQVEACCRISLGSEAGDGSERPFKWEGGSKKEKSETIWACSTARCWWAPSPRCCESTPETEHPLYFGRPATCWKSSFGMSAQSRRIQSLRHARTCRKRRPPNRRLPASQTVSLYERCRKPEIFDFICSGPPPAWRAWNTRLQLSTFSPVILRWQTGLSRNGRIKIAECPTMRLTSVASSMPFVRGEAWGWLEHVLRWALKVYRFFIHRLIEGL